MSDDGETWIAPNPAIEKDPGQHDAFGKVWKTWKPTGTFTWNRVKVPRA